MAEKPPQMTAAPESNTGITLTMQDGTRRAATPEEIGGLFEQKDDLVRSMEQQAASEKITSSREIASAHAQIARITRQNNAQQQQLRQMAKMIEDKDAEIARLKTPLPGLPNGKLPANDGAPQVEAPASLQ